MNKIKTFFHSFVKSITSPEYYREVLKVRAWFSWQYFIVLNFLIAIVMAVVVMVPVAMFDLSWLADKVAATYPAELEVRLEDGQLSVNQELPYTVSLPSQMEWFDEETELGFKHLVTFTSDEEFFGVPEFDAYESLAVVTESTAYFLDQDQPGSIRSYTFDELGSEARFTLNSDLVQQVKSWFLDTKIVKHKLYVPALGAAALMLLFPAMLLWRMWALVFLSFFLWLLTKVAFKSAELSYGQLYKVGLHSMTAVILASWVLGMLHVIELSGRLYVVVYLGWNWFLLKSVVGESASASQKKVAKTKPSTKTATKLRKRSSK